MIKTDVGGQIYPFGLATASFTFTPLFDRAAFVRRINITNVSANDNWTISVGQRVLMTVRILTVGLQQVLSVAPGLAAGNQDWWEFCRNVLNVDASIPVPNGQSLVIASVGGATADVEIEAEEVDVSDANRIGLNHYMGTDFLIPITHFLSASQSLPGAIQCDTQVSPNWVPALFSATALPVNWDVKLLAVFLEGMGVNTFSGAANHQSITQDVRIFRNNVLVFTRQGNGIPNVGKASAAGSANTVFGQRSGIFPPFNLTLVDDDPLLPVPIALGGGDVLQVLQEITGDLTGGASYANSLIVWAARVKVPAGAVG